MGGKRQEAEEKTNTGKASARKRGEREEILDLRDIRGVSRNENVFARPNGLRENTGTAISGSEPGPAKKKRYTSSREEEEEEDAQMCPCGTGIASRTYIVKTM